ncbi:MAG: peptidase S8/S53 domain-containing protein, partial [Benniella sp.]
HSPTSSRPELESASVGNLVWYSTTMHPTTAAFIEKQQAHRIKYVIPDLSVQMYGHVQRHPPSWSLDRIDQRTNKLDDLYHYPASAGQNVTIYVRCQRYHKDFEGRAQHGPVFLPGTDDSSDVNGHGTFVAALAAGSIYGVAKNARIVSLKTLDDSGAGRLSNVLAASEWVVRRHVSQAEHNEPTNAAAIQEAMRLGVHFSIAAGNDGRNACQFSPASTPGATTVGATDHDDAVASYSNWGPCVAVYAPGSDIVSAWRGSKTASHVQSGTSMAWPHVAGLMALLLSESPDVVLRTVT